MATYTTSINKDFTGEFSIVIKHATSNGFELQTPIVEDGVKWETERQGSPGKLTFKVYKDKNGGLSFQEGDPVMLRYKDGNTGWIDLFSGYVFKKSRNKDGWISVTAYDQLRYFKNKATYVYTNKKASDIVQMISNDYKLTTGTIDSTSYVIGSRAEDDQSLFDIIQNAIDLTLVSTGKLYVLYSDNGKIQLRDVENMKTNIVINDLAAEDFDYTSSIDDETYNEVELYYDNDKTNKREYYVALDQTNIGTWGRLRLTESIDSPANAKDRATKTLQLYDKKTRTLKVKNAFGDYHCRAGASVIVNLDLGDIVVSNYMLIEKATHTFSANKYQMDLTLDGFKLESQGAISYNEYNVVKETSTSSGSSNNKTNNKTDKPNTDANEESKDSTPVYSVTVNCLNPTTIKWGYLTFTYWDVNNKRVDEKFYPTRESSTITRMIRHGRRVIIEFSPYFTQDGVEITSSTGNWQGLTSYTRYIEAIDKNGTLNFKWV